MSNALTTIYEDNAGHIFLHRLGDLHAVLVDPQGDLLQDVALWDDWADDVDEDRRVRLTDLQARIIGVVRQDGVLVTDGYHCPGFAGLQYLDSPRRQKFNDQ